MVLVLLKMIGEGHDFFLEIKKGELEKFVIVLTKMLELCERLAWVKFSHMRVWK